MLRFDGVDSCFAVWVNGVELGNSKGSRLPVEFDVAELLCPGENVIAVRVHQWSSGSYLEDQDMWWLSGIFRSVSLLARPADGLADFFVHADYDHQHRHRARCASRRAAAAPCSAFRSWASTDAPADESREFGTVEPWSAESPRLYDARTGHAAANACSCASVSAPWRSRDGQLLVNGKRDPVPRREPARVAPRSRPRGARRDPCATTCC